MSRTTWLLWIPPQATRTSTCSGLYLPQKMLTVPAWSGRKHQAFLPRRFHLGEVGLQIILACLKVRSTGRVAYRCGVDRNTSSGVNKLLSCGILRHTAVRCCENVTTSRAALQRNVSGVNQP